MFKFVWQRQCSPIATVDLRSTILRFCWGLIVCFSARTVPAQQVYPQPAGNDAAGFQAIFDGKTLDGWEGDPKYWRVENGCLVGEVTPETLLKQNTFIIWRRGTTRDFELKVDYRISSRGNSGINYRSEEIPNTSFAMRGYQADIDGANKYTGQNYEEKGRTFLRSAATSAESIPTEKQR